jgi:hypothetical protein
MKMQIWTLTAHAWPSCLCDEREQEQVRKISVTVERPFSQMGRINRNKLSALAFRELLKLAPQFYGVARSVGGMTHGEPKLKGGAS